MANEQFFITGAKRNSAPFSMENMAGCYHAVLYELDFAKEKIVKSYIEEEPDMEIHPATYSFSFRGLSVHSDIIYTCNGSEILEIDKNTFQVLKRISLPVFNDLHHVDIINGNITFASTGIDHIGFIKNGEVELHSSLPEAESRVIDDTIDYRAISTKPHLSHPNYVFEIDGKTWITRFHQKDAICLEDPSLKLDIGTERPHDGLVVGDKVYFTTVNGAITVFNKNTQEKLEVHDLQSHYKQPKIGWCRGIEVIGDFAYIGFTRLRKTRSIENLGFLTDRWDSMMTSIKGTPPARIIKYDLKNRKIIKEMVFNNSQLSVLFSLKHK